MMLLVALVLAPGCGNGAPKEPLSKVDPAGNLKTAPDGHVLGPDGKKARASVKSIPGGKINGPGTIASSGGARIP